MSRRIRSGPPELAIVLHTHMPYVEGFGTWPFGEEWLWEAMATSYLPLLDVLDERITLSLTPVLCDQLEAPGIAERFTAFLRDVRRASHELDARGCRDSGRPDLADELERAGGQYEAALDAFDGDLLGALAPHAAWTSSATHAVLPLLATDAGARLQVQTGIASQRARFGDGWRGGFWLPECAHAPWLDPGLAEAGVHATCVDLTDVAEVDTLTPLRSPAGPLLVPIDRPILELVWSDAGYPAGQAYRDYHHRTTHDHHPWSNDGEVYDRGRALAQVRADAADFVGRARERVAGGGLSVCALDTELLGHWWHEGVDWLRAVLVEADAQGLTIAHLDDALERHDAVAAPDLPTSTWGRPRTLHTWDGPQVAGLAWGARRAELDVVDAIARGTAVDPDRAARELLARQSSDWAFLETFRAAGDYPLQRAEGHEAGLRGALVGSGPSAIRDLARHASVAPLRQP